MKQKNTIIILVFILLLLIIFFGYYKTKNGFFNKETNQQIKNEEQLSDKIIRPTAVAGSFYPKNYVDLNKTVDELLAKTDTEAFPLNNKPLIVIVPHAGYEFSGQTAAYGFKILKNHSYDTVFLISNSHKEIFSGIALDDSDMWQTPLGYVEIDKQMVELLNKSSDKTFVDQKKFLDDHILEVELPFLQKTLNQDFKIVPILFGSENINDINELISLLAKNSSSDSLFIISSDLSHYPKDTDAERIDEQTINSILSGDVQNFLKTNNELMSQNIEGLKTTACAKSAILTALGLAEIYELRSHLLKYSHSTNDPERVVGYSSIAFSMYIDSPESKKTMELKTQEKQAALKLARQTLEKNYGLIGKINEDYKEYEIFNQNLGVFVTLNKNGVLRGCIGILEPIKTLALGIQEMAVSAALNDVRFEPVAFEELKEIDIEISVITKPIKTKVKNIEMGKHGVIVKKGFAQGVYLPQVATDTGWSKEEFLSHLCHEKAHLERNCYQDPDTEIYTFEALVFGEKENE